MDNSKLNKIKKSLQVWVKSIYTPEHSLNPKNLHIDEIEPFKKIKRDDWIYDSFFVFKVLLKEFKIEKPLTIFLHVDLSYSEKKISVHKITLEWLQNNLGEYTPPSFHCTTYSYYENFYKQQSSECYPENILKELLDDENNLVYLYRTYYDGIEQKFSRELYIFSI